jgi:hypothetical protein
MIEIRGEGDKADVFVAGKEIRVWGSGSGAEAVMAQCSLEDLDDEMSDHYPHGLSLDIVSYRGQVGVGAPYPRGWTLTWCGDDSEHGKRISADLIEKVNVTRREDKLLLTFQCSHDKNAWEGRIGLRTLLEAIRNCISHYDRYTFLSSNLDNEYKSVEFSIDIPGSVRLKDAIHASFQEVTTIINEAEVTLGGFQWKLIYESDEKAFCTEVLLPLLRRMGFLAVRYQHGTKEYGKDFTFSEMTPFDSLRHYGLQAKAGDITGKVNSAVDEIIGQVEDAFSMPYYETGSKEPRYISTFIVAISGTFAANAKDKIAEKIAKGVIGSVLFLDRQTIIAFAERYWFRKE